MGYMIIDEDAKTIAHNTWTRPIFGTNSYNSASEKYHSSVGTVLLTLGMMIKFSNVYGFLVSLTSAAMTHITNQITNGPDKIDEMYFDSMYKISGGLKSKIAKWCLNIKATQFKYSDLNQGAPKVNKKSGIWVKPHDYQASANKYKAAPLLFNKPKEAVNTATCYKKVEGSKKGYFYLIYFTFDSKSIKNTKVLTYVGKNPKFPGSYKVIDLPEFKSVKKKEYKR